MKEIVSLHKEIFLRPGSLKLSLLRPYDILLGETVIAQVSNEIETTKSAKLSFNNKNFEVKAQVLKKWPNWSRARSLHFTQDEHEVANINPGKYFFKADILLRPFLREWNFHSEQRSLHVDTNGVVREGTFIVGKFKATGLFSTKYSLLATEHIQDQEAIFLLTLLLLDESRLPFFSYA